MKKIAFLPISPLLLILSTFFTLKGNSQTIQNFTTSGTFTTPAGVTSITVQAWGGGGSGSNITSNGRRGGGGGGGAFASSVIVVTPGNNYAVVVGAGGSSNANGGNSTFNGTSVVAAGGARGTNDNTTAGSGGLATASTGTIKWDGGNGAGGGLIYSGGGGGGAGSTGSGNNALLGVGGASRTLNGGTGANGVSGSSNGNNGSNYGAGGSGAVTNNGADRNGGSGANGLVVLSYTCPAYSLTSTVVSTSLCIGNTATVTLNGSTESLPIGTYIVTYNQSTPNTATGVTKTMTVSTPGTGSFTTNTLNNSGTTTITITNLTSSSCSSTISTNRTADIIINAIPTITGTTTGSRNGVGTVNLSATGSAGTINWYTTLVGGPSLGTGTSFITPSISTSTTYYVSTTNGNCISTPRVAVVATVNHPDIDVRGNNLSIPGNGTNSPILTNNTNFGTVQVTSVTVTKTFAIHNSGSTALTLGAISLTGSSNFTLDSFPVSGTIIAIGDTANIVVSFYSSTVGIQNDVLTIASNDPDEAFYQINLTAEANKVFYDSDNDGVFDDQDIDDDNDGVIDSEEENNCRSSSTSNSVNYKFLEETFGTGTARTTINTSYAAMTDYCWEDGTGDDCNNSASDDADLDDGEYTVYYKVANGDGINQTPNNELASWADSLWYTGDDHTSGDTNGRMAVFNASFDPGVFYTAQITGALPNVPVTYSFYALNLDRWNHPNIATRIRPRIRVEFQDLNGNILDNLATPGIADAFFETGDIDPWNPSNPDNGWFNFSEDLILTVNEFQVIFYNDAPGGLGNDLAIDDIEIIQTLCDTDNDGIADVFDLDSDNDGIPDIVEVGLGQLSNGTGKMDVAWVDANGDGLHDSAAGNTALDSDGDGVPNYLDLDSDNDGIFDVDESGAGNSEDVYFQNGDGDINGDGVGDGLDSEAFREKDVYGNGITQYFGDGILDVYDFYSSANNYAGAYGNNGQGTVTGTVYYVKDSDLDGIPDYIDSMSNGSTYDIAGTLYASLDANNDGVIDDTNDTDGDGILDLFDIDDNAFGSPRDLNQKLHLFFDGRNDYGEDSNVISSGEASIMIFIKSNGNNTLNEDRIIGGQDDFYLRINNADNTVSLIIEGTTLTSTTAITDGIWTHIAATTKSGSSKLYLNGVEEASDTSGGLSDTSNFIIGRSSAGNKHFHGYMDELRVFSKALSEDELHKMIYQEIENNSGVTSGVIIPRNITDFVDDNTITPLNWSSVARYFRMDAYKDDILDDVTTPSVDTGTGARIYNTKIIDVQSAPLPFVTQQSGILSSAVDIPSNGVNGNDVINYDWSIVKISHDDVTYNANQKHVGLIVDATDASSNPIEFSIQNNSELNVSWYLKLDGFIDLEGESQLVQGTDSEIDITSSGYVERDQQGTKDLFTYNYWSSPVGIRNNSTNNNSYNLTSILKDGSIAATPVNINFLSSGYNGNPGNPGTTPISIADYWIWKYSNRFSNTYSQWQHVRRTGTILAGEGFTMKGVQNTGGNITLQQNYVFNGKPNNGNISLFLSPGNDYLIGNPYPSALNADEFIKDNISVASGGRATTDIINGTLYFWDHFASNTHTLSEYQGGYATYNLMSSAIAVSTDTRINATGLIGTRTPEKYIPVSQGFFVLSDSGGTVTFKNSQRDFKTEASDPSLFIKSSNTKSKFAEVKNPEVDERPKFKLMFDSPKGYHRQIAIGVDENASNGFDIGYDAPLIENNKEDMFWISGNDKYVIQGVDNFNDTQKLPLGIKVSKEGIVKIKMDVLENIPDNQKIYLNDKDLGIEHSLKDSYYEVYLLLGNHSNRFEITFKSSESKSLHTDTFQNENIQVYFSNVKESIVILNPALTHLKSIEIINLLGQSIYKFTTNTSEKYMEFKINQMRTGAYIIKVQTQEGIISKKILIK